MKGRKTQRRRRTQRKTRKQREKRQREKRQRGGVSSELVTNKTMEGFPFSSEEELTVAFGGQSMTRKEYNRLMESRDQQGPPSY